GRKPFQSVNFITSHDGFTLNDLVSYADKHNLENGEQNRDGMNENLSSNYGIEGETNDHAVNRIRDSQLKNLLLTLLLSLGTPMLLGGDEMRRTQGGNNNAYCQNNEISWYNWDLKKQHGDVFRFCRELISFRRRHAAFTRPKFYEGKDTANNTLLDITWFNESGGILDWSKSEHTLCFLIDGSKAETAADREDNDFFIILNALGSERKVVITPARTGTKWFLAVDTSRESPADVLAHGEEVPLRPQDLCIVRPRSAVVLLSR
ncbi:MAG TPA: glycogen debranching enzyme, partial [Spirochaetia bacterium]|nr:glycogen debranching enzyme [Spirochaetia bacterium]